MKHSMDCYQAVRVSNVLFIGGVILALLGIALDGFLEVPYALVLLTLPGAVLAVAGYVLNVARAVCPRCGAHLGDLPRMAEKVPAFCPHCGEKL